MLQYNVRFEYGGSGNELHEIRVPTETKYALGVKVTDKGSTVDGQVTLKDGSTTIQPTETRQGYSIFNLESGSTVNGGKTYGVKLQTTGYETKNTADFIDLSSSSSFFGEYRIPLKKIVSNGHIEWNKVWVKCQTKPPKGDFGPYNVIDDKVYNTSYSNGKYNTGNRHAGFAFTSGLFIVKNDADYDVGKGWNLIPKVSNGEAYLVYNDGTKTGRDSIPNAEYKELDSVDFTDYLETGFLLFTRLSNYWRTATIWYGDSMDEPMKANFKGVEVRQDEFDVVEVKDEVNRLSFEDEEGEKQTIEAKDIATKDEMPKPMMSIARIENTSSGEYTLVVKGKVEDFVFDPDDEDADWSKKKLLVLVEVMSDRAFNKVSFVDGDTVTSFNGSAYFANGGILWGYLTPYNGCYELSIGSELVELTEAE